LDAENWYSVPLKEVVRAGARALLGRYNGSHIEALTEIYHELILKEENFVQYRMWLSPENQRKFFDGFATSKDFDPLYADNWRSVTQQEIKSAGGAGLLRRYHGSHIMALVQLYPELMLKKDIFLRSKKGWKLSENQRKFFDTFARSKKFNPLDAEKWYCISFKDVLRAGGRGLLQYHKSHVEAIMKAYPELALKKEYFCRSRDVWKIPENRRKFFDSFAISNHFNPLNAAKWCSVSYRHLRKAGARSVLNYYNGSHIKALISLYPELRLKRENFFKSTLR